MQCSVTPQNLNHVDVSASGTAGLDGRVSVTMTGTFTPGTTFTLLNAGGGVFGTFRSESINFRRVKTYSKDHIRYASR